ncbi:hypothetical protein PR048_031829 [Dryococelus australis]|uniref:CCAAT-binding factor domain-containing protein n=1 Tax=Dryococelus australis TaxID=614101 RepID=A0ABQ9G6D5_9NEOP|nr:hypothetical protein PR048_031829 [Dryococelus australis]
MNELWDPESSNIQTFCILPIISLTITTAVPKTTVADTSLEEKGEDIGLTRTLGGRPEETSLMSPVTLGGPRDLLELKLEAAEEMKGPLFDEEPSAHAVLPQEKTDKLRIDAEKIMADEVTKHELKLSRMRSDHQWMRTVLARGTTSDKIAVHTLLIQESPLYSLSSLESLVNMTKVAKKKECIVAIDTLTELFLSELLPLDRRLRMFGTCPLTDSAASDQPRLLHYYYEDRLKAVYHSFVDALSATARDTVDANKEKAIVTMYKLLSGCPEQEAILLRNLINKLGDPNAKVVSKVIYCLGQLLRTHPNMKAVVMDEIEKLLFRANVSTRAQYYCICFLGQFVFTSNDTSVAKNLIKLYFSFFKACIKKGTTPPAAKGGGEGEYRINKLSYDNEYLVGSAVLPTVGEVDSRMMSVLLMGVNRAYPFAKAEMEQISEHVQTMYKVVHLASFNVSLHTLCLLYHVCDHANSMSDRFYSVLYKKIADPGLMTSSHQAMFLSLVFRALRKDTHVGRIRAFIKRLLQVCMYAPVPLVCGILYMTSQLVYRRSDLLAVSCKASFLDDCDEDGDEHYDDFMFNLHFVTAARLCYAGLLGVSSHFHCSACLLPRRCSQGSSVVKIPTICTLLGLSLDRFLDVFMIKTFKTVLRKFDVSVHIYLQELAGFTLRGYHWKSFHKTSCGTGTERCPKVFTWNYEWLGWLLTALSSYIYPALSMVHHAMLLAEPGVSEDDGFIYNFSYIKRSQTTAQHSHQPSSLYKVDGNSKPGHLQPSLQHPEVSQHPYLFLTQKVLSYQTPYSMVAVINYKNIVGSKNSCKRLLIGPDEPNNLCYLQLGKAWIIPRTPSGVSELQQESHTQYSRINNHSLLWPQSAIKMGRSRAWIFPGELRECIVKILSLNHILIKVFQLVDMESSPLDEERGPSESVEVVEIKEQLEDMKPITWRHGDNMRMTRGMRGGMQYNPFQRNPTFAGAEHTAYVELLELSQHFHPTVALFASNIMQEMVP